jgi:hypothetical protein
MDTTHPASESACDCLRDDDGTLNSSRDPHPECRCHGTGATPVICSTCGADDHAECTGCIECYEPAEYISGEGEPLCETCACEQIANGDASLTDTLTFYGMSHRRTENADVTGVHSIICDGEIVFAGRAHETWTWLRDQALLSQSVEVA